MNKTILLALLLSASTTLLAQQRGNYKPTASTTVKIQETNLPIVFINTSNQMILRNDRITARMKIINNADGTNYGDTIAHPNQTVDYDGYIGLKYRGNSSFEYSDKKPYAIRPLDKPIDEGGKKQKVSLLGMGADNDWAMLAPFADKTMLRDVLTMELARPYFLYVPHMKHCELIVDGTYYGIYILSERVGKGKHRLNLKDPVADEAGNVTGDFHVEVDRPDEEVYYTSPFRPTYSNGTTINNRSITYQYKNPEYSDFAELPEGTQAAINKAIADMESAFHAVYYKDAERGYRKFIDPKSFADYMLASEFAGNVDAYRLSTNLYKYSEANAPKHGVDSRWRTSLWDFNIAYGNANYNSGERTDLWIYQFNDRNAGDNPIVPFYWQRLMNDEAFTQGELKDRWQEYRAGNYATSTVMHKIDSLTTLLTAAGAMERNEQAWRMFGRGVWPNSYVGNSYDDEVAYLKGWIKKRAKWMDRQILGQVMVPSTEPVTVTEGWNQDLIVEALPASAHSTYGVDNHSTYYTLAVNSTGGLPDDLVLTSADGIRYQLAAADRNNALALEGSGTTATLTVEPFATSQLYLLAAAGNGSNSFKVIIHYTDGTTSQDVMSISDWAGSNDGTNGISGLGRIRNSNETFDTSSHSLFEYCLDADSTKQIDSLTFTSSSTAVGCIFALSREVSESDGIEVVSIGNDDKTVVGIYNLSGMRISSPQPGINIVRHADGSSKKIWLK